jgi:hypothetical protein
MIIPLHIPYSKAAATAPVTPIRLILFITKRNDRLMYSPHSLKYVPSYEQGEQQDAMARPDAPSALSLLLYGQFLVIM